jgi:hypothetical protein
MAANSFFGKQYQYTGAILPATHGIPANGARALRRLYGIAGVSLDAWGSQ